MKNRRVVAAMSGGVDSSVAAVLLKEQGYEVIGITLQIWPESRTEDGCCSLSAVEDARRVAENLKIPHYVLNFKDAFFKTVVRDFIDEYKNGRTPNPCIRCNKFIKFDLLLKKARELDANFVATGHYAKIKLKNKEFSLLKGADETKDQSYALYILDQNTLAHTLLPLGGLTKKEVRKIAERYKLPVAHKSESQEICFVPDNNYAGFLKAYVPRAFVPGPIVDETGKEIGRHNGIANYTLGQRKGIRLHTGPWYVTKIDKENNTLLVGNRDKTYGAEVYAAAFNWISGKPPGAVLKGTAKIRYNGPAAQALLYPQKNEAVKVIFEKPQRAITPGQSVVFYQNEAVIGGGVID